jgi:hypothetical protein
MLRQTFPKWGQALYDNVMYDRSVQNVIQSWQSVASDAERRFSVYVDSRVVKGSSEEQQKQVDEASTHLLSLPWELIHNGKGYLFEGAKPVHMRRRLPNTISKDVVITRPPIRILLVSPRP